MLEKYEQILKTYISIITKIVFFLILWSAYMYIFQNNDIMILYSDEQIIKITEQITNIQEELHKKREKREEITQMSNIIIYFCILVRLTQPFTLQEG